MAITSHKYHAGLSWAWCVLGATCIRFGGAGPAGERRHGQRRRTRDVFFSRPGSLSRVDSAVGCLDTVCEMWTRVGLSVMALRHATGRRLLTLGRYRNRTCWSGAGLWDVPHCRCFRHVGGVSLASILALAGICATDCPRREAAQAPQTTTGPARWLLKEDVVSFGPSLRFNNQFGRMHLKPAPAKDSETSDPSSDEEAV